MPIKSFNAEDEVARKMEEIPWGERSEVINSAMKAFFDADKSQSTRGQPGSATKNTVGSGVSGLPTGPGAGSSDNGRPLKAVTEESNEEPVGPPAAPGGEEASPGSSGSPTTVTGGPSGSAGGLASLTRRRRR